MLFVTVGYDDLDAATDALDPEAVQVKTTPVLLVSTSVAVAVGEI